LCQEVAPHTKTIVFENVTGDVVPEFKAFYGSPAYLAKHFLVSDVCENDVNSTPRHYTICNAMRPAIY